MVVVMIMDVVEGSSPRFWPAARWGNPLAVSVEALILFLVAVLVLQQLRSNSVIRDSLLLSYLCKPKSKDGVFEEQQSVNMTAKTGKKVAPSLDHVSGRRQIRSENRSKILNILGLIPDEDVEDLIITEKCGVNSRGVDIFTKSWIPKNSKPKASVCYCHGYGDTCTYLFEGIARKVASQNYAVFSMDHEGFGLSGGLHGFVPDFDFLVWDVVEHFTSIKKQEEYKGIPMFLLGESMGGAIAIEAHLKSPAAWDGAIFIAPMCKISQEMYPPRILIQFLKCLAQIIPKAKLVPSGSIADTGFRDLQKREQAKLNMISYSGKPRLGTALSFLRVTQRIEKNLSKVSLPFLILHGAADTITDPAISQALYEQSCTVDKTFLLYDKAWHAVLVGEPDDIADRAMKDVVEWLDTRTSSKQTKENQ